MRGLQLELSSQVTENLTSDFISKLLNPTEYFIIHHSHEVVWLSIDRVASTERMMIITIHNLVNEHKGTGKNAFKEIPHVRQYKKHEHAFGKIGLKNCW